jgi:cell division protein FtsL
MSLMSQVRKQLIMRVNNDDWSDLRILESCCGNTTTVQQAAEISQARLSSLSGKMTF